MRRLSLLLIIFCLSLFVEDVYSQKNDEVKLVSIEEAKFYIYLSKVAGSHLLEIKNIDKTNNKIQIQTLTSPARIVLDIPNLYATKTYSKEVESSIVNKLRIGRHDKFTRIVVDIIGDKIPQHELKNVIKEEGSLKLYIGSKKIVPSSQKVASKDNLSREPKVSTKQKIEVKKEIQKSLAVIQREIQPSLKPTLKKNSQIVVAPIQKKRIVKESQLKKNLAPLKSIIKQRKRISGPKSFSRIQRNNATENMKREDPRLFPSFIDNSEVLLEENRKKNEDVLESEEESEGSILEEYTSISAGKKDSVNTVNIPETPQDLMYVSAVPMIESVTKRNELVELVLLLVGFSVLFIFLLRRREILSLLYSEKDSYEHEPDFDVVPPKMTLPYVVLGCKETDTDEEIKARYRHLVKVFHTDKLQSQELPKEVLDLTHNQFRKVQEAYEELREYRNI